MLDLQRLFLTPDQFLCAFEGANAAFVEMDRQAYHRSIFTDRRLSPKSPAIQRLKVDAVLAAQAEHASASPLGVCYIFHIAHCGSTLLARALDLPDANLVCREPMALRQLGVEAAGFYGAPPPEVWRRRAALAWTLLGRRYNADGPVIVKANVPVNFALAPLMALKPEQPAILLYYPLEDYLLAILRSDVHRGWVQHVSGELAHGIAAIVGATGDNDTLAVKAARLWLAQLLIFADALGQFPNAASLDAESLFNAPADALSASFAHFGMAQTPVAVDAIVTGELFARYSKDPRMQFDNAQRLERREALRRELAGELEQARVWVAQCAAAARLPQRLAKPLVGAGAPLI
ncbi:MAG: hypothetical protein ACREH4_07410 [Vitreimonas sp.]